MFKSLIQSKSAAPATDEIDKSTIDNIKNALSGFILPSCVQAWGTPLNNP
jgi:hypothetical protein